MGVPRWHERRRRDRTGTFLVYLCLLGACSAAESEQSDKSKWYTRYQEYPPYCSIPSEMEKRQIPPLASDPRTGETELVHVTAIFRHGARTPWGANENCWAGYQDNPETGVWNCQLSTVISPPPPNVMEDETEQAADLTQMFLYDKQYDALKYPLSNALGGTCQLGQLLLQGYEQELANGKHIRKAYLYDTHTQSSHDAPMRLFSTSDIDPWNQVYYRVDDDQRTIMSGQVILRGMLEEELLAYYKKNKQYPIVTLHTADRVRDILTPAESVCPRLVELREANEQTDEFQRFNSSAEATLLRRLQKEVLGVSGGDMEAIDCLTTTMCTDRPLPDAVNDYKQPDSDNEYGSNRLERLYSFDETKYAKKIMLNNAEYAKLGMARMWREIMTNIDGIVQRKNTVCCPMRLTPKLALFSGHDTTIQPLLASLGVWDGKWAPYASMILLELHRVNKDGTGDAALFSTDYAFRLVYNGQVLTSRMTDCPDTELCDLKVLSDLVKTFFELDCTSSQPTMPSAEGSQQASSIPSTAGGWIALVLVAGLSASLGSILTCCCAQRRQKIAVPTDDEDGIALTSNGRMNYADSVSDDDTDTPTFTIE